MLHFSLLLEHWVKAKQDHWFRTLVACCAVLYSHPVGAAVLQTEALFAAQRASPHQISSSLLILYCC
jgi:hypothetical protein